MPTMETLSISNYISCLVYKFLLGLSEGNLRYLMYMLHWSKCLISYDVTSTIFFIQSLINPKKIACAVVASISMM